MALRWDRVRWRRYGSSSAEAAVIGGDPVHLGSPRKYQHKRLIRSLVAKLSPQTELLVVGTAAGGEAKGSPVHHRRDQWETDHRGNNAVITASCLYLSNLKTRDDEMWQIVAGISKRSDGVCSLLSTYGRILREFALQGAAVDS